MNSLQIYCSFEDYPGRQPVKTDRLMRLTLKRATREDLPISLAADELERIATEHEVAAVEFGLTFSHMPEFFVPIDRARRLFPRYIKMVQGMARAQANLWSKS